MTRNTDNASPLAHGAAKSGCLAAWKNDMSFGEEDCREDSEVKSSLCPPSGPEFSSQTTWFTYMDADNTHTQI